MKSAGSDSSGLKLWDTPKGRYWMPEGSARALSYDLAEQDRKIYGSGSEGVHAGDVVLDCGANVGVFTRTALEAGAGLVVAIEPAPENIECLRRNFEPEIAQGKVRIYPKGVWDKPEVLTFNVDPKNSARDSFVGAKDAPLHIQVPVTTIDQLAEELGLSQVDFIKMDIEGAETKALAGARRTIARFKPRMSIALYHLKDDAVQVPLIARKINPQYRYDCRCLVNEGGPAPEVGQFY
jgi:FkbM family methyltransferase